MWTNSTRPPQRRQPSQWTMRLLSPRAPDDRLGRAGIGAHPRTEAARSASTVLPRSDAGLAATPWAHRHAGNRAAAPARKPWCRLSARDTRSIADAAEQEQPLVVVSAASFVEPERRVLTLASDPHHSATGTHLISRKRRRLTSGKRRARIGIPGRRRGAETGRRPARSARRAGLRLGGRTALARHATRRKDDVPLAILGHRILVFLAKKSTLNENVEAGRVVAATHLPHVEVDRASDLLSAEDEFSFLLALRLRAPDRHRDGHHDHHDANADQQRRHRVAALAALTTL